MDVRNNPSIHQWALWAIFPCPSRPYKGRERAALYRLRNTRAVPNRWLSLFGRIRIIGQTI